MTALKLRDYLTSRISKMEDVDFLNAIKIILESREAANDVYHLNDFEKNKIKKSRQQFKKGLGISNEKVFDKMEKWLKEK